jgi:hypothetical protein
VTDNEEELRNECGVTYDHDTVVTIEEPTRI